MVRLQTNGCWRCTLQKYKLVYLCSTLSNNSAAMRELTWCENLKSFSVNRLWLKISFAGCQSGLILGTVIIMSTGPRSWSPEELFRSGVTVSIQSICFCWGASLSRFFHGWCRAI
ncbi:hypothetical protein M758_8G124500 [Ceratodon purpureus]|nr:hypothetical protein M758_8G124500 [Ceratodon purpureus]